MESENQRRKKAEEIIDNLLDWILANRNLPDHEFITCYTVPHGTAPTCVIEAKQFLVESVNHLLERDNY